MLISINFITIILTLKMIILYLEPIFQFDNFSLKIKDKSTKFSYLVLVLELFIGVKNNYLCQINYNITCLGQQKCYLLQLRSLIQKLIGSYTYLSIKYCNVYISDIFHCSNKYFKLIDIVYATHMTDNIDIRVQKISL